MALHAMGSGAMKARNRTWPTGCEACWLEYGIAIAPAASPTSTSTFHKRWRMRATSCLDFLRQSPCRAEYDQLKLQEQHLHERCTRCCSDGTGKAWPAVPVERVPGLRHSWRRRWWPAWATSMPYANGRQVSAWAGDRSQAALSGGKQRLLGISKRGDAYLRTLLIHGARSVIAAIQKRSNAGLDPRLLSRTERWVLDLVNRSNANVAAASTGQQERQHRVGNPGARTPCTRPST